MRIKSIELVGFKSFYEKTSIHFHSEMNAIVGPNGCGKSNILDAIRWVLGEQNPRRLRAEEMEEVIANGGESLKPLGMAEVSLTLTGAPRDGFDEVIIKRRLFRSGESEYYINGTPCRLKDIAEMFMDTGVGARAYSTIPQGKVESLITTRPEERRGIIEEVAGLVKYKSRRRETESRIESTKENLRRIRDVIGEVNRQMQALNRQAKDADEFKRLSEEMKHLELKVLKSKLRRLERERDGLSDERSEIENSILQLRKRIEERESTLKDIQSEVALIERHLEDAEKETYGIKSDLQAKESLLELVRNEASGINEFIDRLEKDIELLKGEEEIIRVQIGNKRRSLEEVTVELSSNETQLRETENLLSSIKAELTKSRAELDAIRTTLFKVLDRYSSLKGMAFGYEKELAELRSRRERIEKEILEVGNEREKTSSRISELEVIMEGIRERRSQIEEKKADIAASLFSLNSSQESRREESKTLGERLKEVYSRLNILKQIQSNYEWLPEEIRRFLLERRGNGILGVIADFISVPKGYEQAIEAAFGDKLKWVLVKESEEALRAIESLRELSIGRGTFIPINGTKRNGDFKKNVKGILPLSQIIRIEGIDRDVIENMIKGVFVVSSLREALSLRDEMEEGTSFVTLNGDLLHSTGAISGGFDREGVFERKREIEDLSIEVSGLEETLSIISREIESNQAEIERLENALQSLEKELVEIGIREAEVRKDISNLRDNLLRAERRYEVIDFDLREVGSEIEEKEAKLLEVRATIRRLEDEKTVLEERFREIEERVQKSEAEEGRLEAGITGLMIQNAALIEKEKGIKEDIEELGNRQKGIRERIELETKEIESKKEERLNLIRTDETTIDEVRTLLDALRKKEEEVSAIRNRRNESLFRIKAFQDELEGLRRDLGSFEERSNALGFRLNGLKIEIEHTEDAIKRSGLDIEGVFPESPESTDGEEDEEGRLRELRERIEKFGPVNLLAPEEYRNLEERHRFLTEQMEDLVNALSSLRKAINRIDREYEKRFKESFDVVNGKFQEVFGRLFKGGEAKLVLTNPDDILQTGVEIMARPRGKRFQSVNLLSGGEKALSAIALVISACFVKPVPFLLLDEIDAPLDDASTSQLVELLKDIARNSQIIIMTHNKKTMQAVNALIGITSDKPGVSKVVSVELRGN